MNFKALILIDLLQFHMNEENLIVTYRSRNLCGRINLI